MKVMKTLVLTLALLAPQTLWALGVDEKLPLRILKVSGSRKTLLINRGLEDGLTEGDHAKFFVSTGVVARGVLVKASPTRSVWSVYRLVNSEFVNADQVMNLKISTALKVTDDPTKMLSPEDTDEEVQVARGDQIPETESLEEPVSEKELDSELSSVKDTKKSTAQIKDVNPGKFRTWEIWGMAHVSSLTSSAQSEQDTGTVNYGGKLSYVDFSLGLEKYFSSIKEWYSGISLAPFMHKSVQEVTSVTGQGLQSDVLEAGMNLHWHFTGKPQLLEQWVWYGLMSFALGTTKDSFYNSATPSQNTEVEGNHNSFAVGAGLKYISQRGYGVRASLDYYKRSESFINESDNQVGTYKSSKTVTGPRILVGLSYRW